MKMEMVWVQNLKGFIQGTFPADEKWKTIFIEQLDAIAAPASAEPVKVKPLEWKCDDWLEVRWTAHTRFDNAYGIAVKDENFPGEQCILWGPEGGKGTRHASIDEAKAAAQADYDQRIRSALANEAKP